jgi:hypothetical protein
LCDLNAHVISGPGDITYAFVSKTMCKPTSWCAGGWCDLSGAVAGETIPYYRFNIRLRTGNTNGVGTNRVDPSANRTCGPPGTTDPRPCSAAFSVSATTRSAETWVNPGSLRR